MLKAQGLAHCLKLVHFHVGSQVPDISTIKRAVREAARYYAKLSKMGHELGYLDVGGGLGVDYDGSRTSFDSSTNYSLQEYCNDVVYNIMEVCDSEGGRASGDRQRRRPRDRGAPFRARGRGVRLDRKRPADDQNRGGRETIPSRCATSSR